jgi:hypothetical protein
MLLAKGRKGNGVRRLIAPRQKNRAGVGTTGAGEQENQ